MNEHAPEEDVLISRLIDGVATDAERARFAYLAESTPPLWRELACRQQDMFALSERVRIETASAASMDLPRRWLAPSRISWTMALSGWAAVLIVMVSWAALALAPRPGAPITTEMVTEISSPEDHFSEYLDAPYVLGDMQPLVLGVDEVSDGRIAVRFMRRVEEILFVDPDGELPVDESGELLRDLRAFRQ